MESEKTKTKKLIEKKIRLGTRDRGYGERELEEGSQKVQTSSYKINNYWGGNVQHGDCS